MATPLPPTSRHAVLIALTLESRAALGAMELAIAPVPFHVGRESRRIQWTKEGIISERRDTATPPSNHLYLTEKGDPMNVSREHLQIDRDGDQWLLLDKGSTCGTLVEGNLIGGEHRGGQVVLQDGDVIIVGSGHSPFVFKFRLR